MYQDPVGEPFRESTSREVVIDREPVVRSYEDTRRYGERVDVAVLSSHWRSTLTGTLAALTVLLFLGLLGLGMGLAQFNAATAAMQGALPAGLGRNVGMWTAFSLLVAFMLGGYVAGRLESVRRPEHGAWRGALVFVLASPLLLWLLLGGLAGAGGAVAGTVAGLHVDPATQARANPTAVGDIAGHLRDATWFILFGCVLGFAASAIGGMLAAPREALRAHRIGRHDHDHRERGEPIREPVRAEREVRLDETAPLDSTRRETVTDDSADRVRWTPRAGR